MYRVLCVMVLTFCVVALAGLQTAIATLAQVDSSAFTYKYEMDVAPTTQDIAPGTGVDWDWYTNHGSGIALYGPESFTANGGFVNGDGTVTTAGGNWQFQLESDQGNAAEAWHNISAASGYTIEVRMQTAQASGALESIGIMTGVENVGQAASLLVGDNKVIWGLHDYTTGAQALDSNANNDVMHTFRIAQLPGQSTFEVWRDGVQIGTDLGGAPGLSALTLPFALLGASTGEDRGANVIDYVRITSGAYAPVASPEPGMVTLLVTGLIGLLAYAWRKRK
jgi:hypothetical protein